MTPAPIGPDAFVGMVRDALAAAANPQRAARQQAYMRSALPFHGIAMPALRRSVGGLCRAHPLADVAAWRRAIRLLWDGATHREEWYAALVLARGRSYAAWALALDSLPLWRHLIETGAWWDVGDEITEHLIAPMLAAHPAEMTEVLRGWSGDPDRWVRRAAVLAQNRRRADTDTALLSDSIEGSLDDADFFARKAIGWALREYSRTDPGWVTRYVAEHADRLSGLSTREALRLIR